MGDLSRRDFVRVSGTAPPVFHGTCVYPEATGPTGGRRNAGDCTAWAIWKFSKSVEAAKEYQAA